MLRIVVSFVLGQCVNDFHLEEAIKSTVQSVSLFVFSRVGISGPGLMWKTSTTTKVEIMASENTQSSRFLGL